METVVPKRSVKERWAILRKALLEKRTTNENFEAGKRLGLVTETGNPHEFAYQDLKLTIFPPNLQVSHEKLIGFNNTGNVRIWQAEEALVDYVLTRIPEEVLESGKILELGGGFSSLAAQFLARKFPKSTCFLTDGNLESVEHCQKLVRINELENAFCKVVRWDQADTYDCNNNEAKSGAVSLPQKLDVVLIADCFFFDEYRAHLAKCLTHFIAMNPRVKVVVIGPSRNGTYEKFLKLMDQEFSFSTPVFYPLNQTQIMLSTLN